VFGTPIKEWPTQETRERNARHTQVRLEETFEGKKFTRETRHELGGVNMTRMKHVADMTVCQITMSMRHHVMLLRAGTQATEGKQ
jgi:hypothetical protein